MDTRRVFLTGIFVSFVFLGVSALTGCGPSFNGSLPGRDGDGSGPKPLPGQAQVTSLSPSTVVAGAGSFTLTVYGMNFTPTTSALWDNNTSLATTYISSTVLLAQVPASLITKPGTVTIVPSPLGTFNFGTNFTITVPPLTGNNSLSISMVSVQANDMVWDQASQQLYLSVAKGNSTNANTITALNPQTGALGSSVSTGGEPGKLAVSNDGTYIYAGIIPAINSGGPVHRYTLPTLQSDIDIPLGSGYGPYYAIDVAVQPGSSHSVAVSRGVMGMSPRELGGIIIYDDAVARPQSVPGFGPGPGPIDSLLWNPNGQSLYGSDMETSEGGLYIMSVSSAGLQLQTPAPAASSGGNVHFDSTTGYLYSDSGKVFNPATVAVIGRFPLNTIQGGLNGTSIMVPDGRLNIAYFLGQRAYGGGVGYVIEAYDLTDFIFLGAIPIPNVTGIPSKMIRWGSNGLAFMTDNGVYLVSGGFVTSPAP